MKHSATFPMTSFFCGLKRVVLSVVVLAITLPSAAANDGESKETAYTVTEYQQLASVSGFVWVKGYIVGSTYRNINNAQFAAGSVDTNLLLAASAECKEISLVVPLELPQGALRDALNLKDHPENLGRFVAVQAKAETYFAVRGLKGPTGFAFVDDVPDTPDDPDDPDVPDTPDDPQVVHDTVYVDRVDTLFVSQVRVDSVYIDRVDTLTVRDTISVYVTQHDTLTVLRHDTLTILRHDTLTVRDSIPVYITRHDTLYVTQFDTLTVRDTLSVYVTVHDTLWQTQTVHDTLTVRETVVERDTLWLTEHITVHDTVWQERMVVAERLDTVWLSDVMELPEPTIHYDGERVTIVSALEGATLYYTLDGTEPLPDTALRYDKPFVVTDDCVVTAVAVQISVATSRGIDTKLPYLRSEAVHHRCFGVDGRASEHQRGTVIVDENGNKRYIK